MCAADIISRIHARQVLDSRGNPTVEVEVHCRSGVWGRAIVPSGASTGRHEAVELRDGNPRCFGGKGVLKAVANVKEILGPALVGMAVDAQMEIDQRIVALDGTSDKSRLGANALLGVSLACAHAAAAVRKQPLWKYLNIHVCSDFVPRLPLPMVNLISGGLHAGKNLEFQDFLLLPIGARSYSETLHMAVTVYRALAERLTEHGLEGTLVADEGGFGPKLAGNVQAVEQILAAFERAGLSPGQDAAIALDVAGTHFFKDGRFVLRDRVLDAPEMVDFLKGMVDRYPILSIEDGMAEDDWDGWKMLTQALGDRVQLIGDDLFVTNPLRLKKGAAEKVANSILIKVNQIGTLTETFEVMRKARDLGYRCVVSARSGETEDATIADLAVATGAGQIKIGSVVRSERLAKYNQLLRIEEEMGAIVPFARWVPVGATPLAPPS